MHGDAGRRRFDLRGVSNPAATSAAHCAATPVERSRASLGGGVDQAHLVAGEGEDLRDAGAHQPGADDEDVAGHGAGGDVGGGATVYLRGSRVAGCAPASRDGGHGPA